ncbi:DUF3461 family protein [Oceanisphaera psychrotolerans]|uniref:DUF3461 domain-containing protein n=1 Tax=Oceanisphaera psychrotolerans TaxID=1414654 RepID=A0A1J4QBF1_9GAMM|nr:DUF3461 family protein [Oceanisphaera psychrotolerans]OIN03796.1 hypothetical protein BFR47_07415 [Oceanisphaera psychrotolerans]
MPVSTTLTAMGIDDIDAISRFTISRHHDHEVLKVYFERPADSCLPASLKFRFPCDNHSEVQATLQQVRAELEQILEQRQPDPRMAIVQNLEQLEQVMEDKMAELKRRLAELPD